MAIAPFDYTPDVKSPFASVLEGFTAGAKISDVQAARAEEERKRIAQAAMQADFNALATNPAANNEDYARLITKYPSLSEHFKRAADLMSESRRDTMTKHVSQVYAALSAGKPDIALQLVKEQGDSLRNSGREAEAKSFDVMSELIKTSPTAAKTSAGLMLSATLGSEKFAESFSKIQEEGRKAELFDPEAARAKEALELKKSAADLGLTSAQTNKAILEGKKLSAETAKLFMEMESLKKTGGMDPTKKFDMEDKLRKQYVDRTGKYIELRGTFDVIKASASDASGAGDMALVTSFMKMLDPTSVVRETEFAKAQDTAGLLQRLSNAAQKLQAGSFLDTKQREDFERLAGRYLKAAEEHEKRVRKDLGTSINSYGLSAENVFGSAEPPKSPVPETLPVAVPPASAAAVSDTTRSLLDKYGPK